ncbi:EH signature domain-containing protein [Cellulomonas xiejunii]|uniref:EH signature domain-containing protein n=1 Tax=Cellulomonas xiejunii TaxID=2968083 RepID=A0ABY5KMD3_9CELL|nr:EH signature domain-containing protein [Cellulomonas xiejunii]MCC2319544.1 EH signature domain-containing protein [Cellulomonas xiejunii]UUI71510.1 EH signature domain-containing protein [Cellulomonas xiejunii]
MRTTLVELPAWTVGLPAWQPSVTAAWQERAEAAGAITERAGTGRNFDALVAEARSLLTAGEHDAVLRRSRDRRFLRAVITVWADDEALARATMTPGLLQSLSIAGVFSRLTTITAVSLLLEHFDLLDEWRPGTFDALARLVREAVRTAPTRGERDVVESLRVNAAVMFVPDGPQRLAAWLITQDIDPVTWLRSHGLSAHLDSRFGRVARDAYFLAWIAAADAARNDQPYLTSITDEVVARQRTETTDADGRYFGHLVLEALTAKPTHHPSTTWLEAVLAIGGDPRAQETNQWRTWWARVSPEAVQRAVRWMQGLNLRAFLDGVEAYARETGNEGMQRMLERRRRFLLGLYEQDLAQDVRLILGDGIRRWIARTSTVATDAAVLRGSISGDTAMVYIDCGSFSLVEGSHNFKLHLYVGGGVPAIEDRSATEFDVAYLREVYPERHFRNHGGHMYLAVTHQGTEWIRTALDFLRSRGVVLDERALMTPNDYADLARRRAGWR